MSDGQAHRIRCAESRCTATISGGDEETILRYNWGWKLIKGDSDFKVISAPACSIHKTEWLKRQSDGNWFPLPT
jgi:hypothetical protein